MMDLEDSGGKALLSTIEKKELWRVRFGLRRLIVENDIQK
jgi:hypothetical protein